MGGWRILQLHYCFHVIGWVTSLLIWNNPKTTMDPRELSRLTGNGCKVCFQRPRQLRSIRKMGNIKGYVGCRPAPGGLDQYFAINPGAAAKSLFYKKNWEPLLMWTVITSHHQPSDTAWWWHPTLHLKASWWFMMLYQLREGVFTSFWPCAIAKKENWRVFKMWEGSSRMYVFTLLQ